MYINMAGIFMVISMLSAVNSYKSNPSNWVCRPCRNQIECDEEPKQLCIYGETRDLCGRRVCAKGPGERCGGTMRIFGECNPALMCIEEVCHGCVLSLMEEDQFDCYPRQNMM